MVSDIFFEIFAKIDYEGFLTEYVGCCQKGLNVDYENTI